MEVKTVEDQWTIFGSIQWGQNSSRRHFNCWIYKDFLSWVQNNSTSGTTATNTYELLREMAYKTYGMPMEVFNNIYEGKLVKPKAEKKVATKAVEEEAIFAVADNGLSAIEKTWMSHIVKAKESLSKEEFLKKLPAFIENNKIPVESQKRISEAMNPPKPKEIVFSF